MIYVQSLLSELSKYFYTMSLAVNEHPWGEGSPVLADLESICWQMLYDAATNRKNAMHQAVIATAVDGVAHLRTVVLRRVDAGSKKIYLHTDLRSKKMVDLIKTGHLSWLVYDQSQRTQIRLSGKVIIHHMDHLCKEHWDKTGHHSRRYTCWTGLLMSLQKPPRA